MIYERRDRNEHTGIHYIHFDRINKINKIFFCFNPEDPVNPVLKNGNSYTQKKGP